MAAGLRIDNGIDTRRVGYPAKPVQRRWFGGVLAHLARSLGNVRRPKTKTLRHVETLTLGAGRAVFLIECNGQRFLLTEGMSTPVPLTQHLTSAVPEDRR